MQLRDSGSHHRCDQDAIARRDGWLSRISCTGPHLLRRLSSTVLAALCGSPSSGPSSRPPAWRSGPATAGAEAVVVVGPYQLTWRLLTVRRNRPPMTPGGRWCSDVAATQSEQAASAGHTWHWPMASAREASSWPSNSSGRPRHRAPGSRGARSSIAAHRSTQGALMIRLGRLTMLASAQPGLTSAARRP